MVAGQEKPENPCAFSTATIVDGNGNIHWGNNGMTIRDYFAAHAPIGIQEAVNALAAMGNKNPDYNTIMMQLAALRGHYADFMLQERAQ